jgi:hypothetical protein
MVSDVDLRVIASVEAHLSGSGCDENEPPRSRQVSSAPTTPLQESSHSATLPLMS